MKFLLKLASLLVLMSMLLFMTSLLSLARALIIKGIVSLSEYFF
jgi:hypothetical protein